MLDKHFIWGRDFEEWKITSSNIDKGIIKEWQQGFFGWALERIIEWANSSEKSLDPELNEVARKLFPEVNPRWWSYILTIYFLGGNTEDTISILSSYTPCFGLGGSSETLKEIEQEKDETIKLASKLFDIEALVNEYQALINGIREKKPKCISIKILEDILDALKKHNLRSSL